jgi:hypothetical protein
MLTALMQKLLSARPHQRPVMSPAELTTLFRKNIDNNRVRVLTQRTDIADVDQVIVGGLYDEYEDREDQPCIEISLYYNKDVQHIDTSQLDWCRLCFDVVETLGHEMVHREQANRPRKKRQVYISRAPEHKHQAEQEYLGHADEIEAYGFSIAAEMSVLLGTNDIDSPEAQTITMYSAYQQTFQHDDSVLIKLRKQISKYLRRLEVEQCPNQHRSTNTKKTLSVKKISVKKISVKKTTDL